MISDFIYIFTCLIKSDWVRLDLIGLDRTWSDSVTLLVRVRSECVGECKDLVFWSQLTNFSLLSYLFCTYFFQKIPKNPKKHKKAQKSTRSKKWKAVINRQVSQKKEQKNRTKLVKADTCRKALDQKIESSHKQTSRSKETQSRTKKQDKVGESRHKEIEATKINIKAGT